MPIRSRRYNIFICPKRNIVNYETEFENVCSIARFWDLFLHPPDHHVFFSHCKRIKLWGHKFQCDNEINAMELLFFHHFESDTTFKTLFKMTTIYVIESIDKYEYESHYVLNNWNASYTSIMLWIYYSIENEIRIENENEYCIQDMVLISNIDQSPRIVEPDNVHIHYLFQYNIICFDFPTTALVYWWWTGWAAEL